MHADLSLVRKYEWMIKVGRLNPDTHEFVVCTKCRYPYAKSGFKVHASKCDGTGPKDTSFGGNSTKRESCKFCGAWGGW